MGERWDRIILSGTSGSAESMHLSTLVPVGTILPPDTVSHVGINGSFGTRVIYDLHLRDVVAQGQKLLPLRFQDIWGVLALAGIQNMTWRIQHEHEIGSGAGMGQKPEIYP